MHEPSGDDQLREPVPRGTVRRRRGNTTRPALCGARPLFGSWGTVSGYAGWERVCKRCLRAARQAEEDEATRSAVRSLPASFSATAWEEED
jgi:hypothetical protein